MCKLAFLVKVVLFYTILGVVSFEAFPKTFIVKSASEFEAVQKSSKPEDTVIWEKGNFHDIHLTIVTDGLFFLAEEPGRTIFSGSSALKVEGNNNIISGFQFVGGKIEGDVVDIFGSYNTIEHVNIESYDSHYYLRVRPDCQYNVISQCNFESKPETQESSVVQIEASEKMIGYHVISHCSFKNHTAPPDAGGDFGIEALRIGYSYQRTFISRTIVEYCYFEKCNGDYEVISNKACENVMRYNTFINNGPAHLTLRHGSRAMVYGNFFLKGAGVRIKEGQNHAVINNYFDTGEQMALQIVNHAFDPVDTVIVSNNTFVTCSPVMLGGKGGFPPQNVSFANNLFSNSIVPLFVDPTKSEDWGVNVIQKGSKVTTDNFTSATFHFKENEFGFHEIEYLDKFFENYVPDKLPIFNVPELDDDAEIKYDIMKQARSEKARSIPGCYLPGQHNSLRSYATSNNTGPAYLQ